MWLQELVDNGFLDLISHDLHNLECQQQEKNIGVLGIPQIAMQFIGFRCRTLKSKSGIWQPCAKSIQ